MKDCQTMRRDNDRAVEKARVTKPRNHRWKPVGGRGTKGQIDHKKCRRCGVEVRRVRLSSNRINEEHRAPGGVWKSTWRRPIPKCTPRVVCSHCKGTGRVVDLEGSRG